MQRPTLFMTVGLPAAGKTTAAQRLERERGALRLSKDEWVKALFGPDNPPAATDVIEGRLIDVAMAALTAGVDVVLDFGLWSRDERSALRAAAHDHGAEARLFFLDLDPAEQRARVRRREAEEPETTWPMSDAELKAWAERFEPPTPDEVDDTEPVGSPPSGFETWADWRGHRWPRSV